MSDFYRFRMGPFGSHIIDQAKLFLRLRRIRLITIVVSVLLLLSFSFPIMIFACVFVENTPRPTGITPRSNVDIRKLPEALAVIDSNRTIGTEPPFKLLGNSEQLEAIRSKLGSTVPVITTFITDVEQIFIQFYNDDKYGISVDELQMKLNEGCKSPHRSLDGPPSKSNPAITQPNWFNLSKHFTTVFSPEINEIMLAKYIDGTIYRVKVINIYDSDYYKAYINIRFGKSIDDRINSNNILLAGILTWLWQLLEGWSDETLQIGNIFAPRTTEGVHVSTAQCAEGHELWFQSNQLHNEYNPEQDSSGQNSVWLRLRIHQLCVSNNNWHFCIFRRVCDAATVTIEIDIFDEDQESVSEKLFQRNYAIPMNKWTFTVQWSTLVSYQLLVIAIQLNVVCMNKGLFIYFDLIKCRTCV